MTEDKTGSQSFVGVVVAESGMHTGGVAYGDVAHTQGPSLPLMAPTEELNDNAAGKQGDTLSAVILGPDPRIFLRRCLTR